ncbi:MAG TPA: SOS response-associated peptidase [Anaerolineales bacterium]|nr:SOS response-associated peptidase [Anaerolineales bacterium]
MCGRFTLTADADTIREAFALSQSSSATLAELTPRYNIAPSQPVAVVLADSDGARKLEFFKWGLVPVWAKDPKIGYKMINARAETLAEKPSFRTALKKRRCLVLADGFYEWKKDGKTKTPMHIQLKSGEPFALAGLYEFWKPPDSDVLVKSCTLITTTPNSLMEKIHDRMPVILRPQAYDLWLTPGELPAEKSLPLLKPYAASQMQAARVSALVNSPANDSPECIKPI